MTDTPIRYNHACTIAFEVISEHETGEDFTPAMLREALQRRLDTVTDDELLEAIGAPYDTYAMEPDA